MTAFIISIIFTSNVVYASNVEYTREVGEKVYATANSLSLSENRKMLLVCYVDGDQSLATPSKCNRSLPIHHYNYKAFNNHYAGWIVKHYQNTYYFKNKWFGYIKKYPELGKIFVTINGKFTDIFNRLYTAQQNRKHLEDTFSEYQEDGINYSKYIGEVDSDIELLSSHGAKLAKVTNRLIKTIKPIIIDAEMRFATISGRKKTMEGLRSFEREMSQINRLPQTAIDDSIQKIINSIDSAIDDLERTLAQ